MSFSRTHNQQLKTNLEKAIKRITIYATDKSRVLTKDESKLIEYRDDLIVAFNKRYSYLGKFYK